MTKIGLIAGSGQFPLIFSKKAKAKGLAVYAAAYLNEADPDLKNHVEAIEWLHLGQIKRLIKFFKKNSITQAVMMGAITKTRIFTDVKPDIKAISIIADIAHTHDDNILRAFARLLEKEGIIIQPSTFLLPELLAHEGCWTRRKPSRSEKADLELGWKIAKEIGSLDIGQCVVIGGGSVLAVEAADGTDAAIARGGKLGKGQAVVVKVCKPTQDTRFDIPAVGIQTIQTMYDAGAKVLAIEAGKTVVFDQEAMISLANQYSISIIAMGENRETKKNSGVKIQEPESRILTPEFRNQNSEVKSGSKLRVAVIGVGYLGNFHAEKYSRMDDVDLVGVVDTDASRSEYIASKYGAKPYINYQELMGKVDAVSVVVPTHEHFVISRYFLEKDIDVLIEKPMTTTLEEADELIRIAESRGRIIQVGHLERFNPAVAALRNIIKKPMFIESHRLSLYKGRGTDVSVVLDLMIHDIDIILNFVRSDIKKIHASGVPVISGHVDIANARLEFENGCIANVTASRISTKNERKIRLFQKDCYISVDFASHDITVIRRQNSEDRIQNSEFRIQEPEVRSQKATAAAHLLPELIPNMEIKEMCFTKGDALEEELKSFVKAVRKRETSEVTGQMGRDALKIALNIMDQIRSANNYYSEDLGESGRLICQTGSDV